jgi:cytochrome c553
MERQQLLQKLMDYQQGTATATVMHQHAKAYTPLELEALATFFSQQSH